MTSYATGNLSYVHWQTPAGATGKRASWGNAGRNATRAWIRAKGYTYTRTTYVTTSGRQASKPTQAQLKAQWQKQQGIEPEVTVVKGKTYPSGITARYRGMDKKDTEKFGFDKGKDFVKKPERPVSFFDVEKEAGRKTGLSYHYGTDILKEKTKVLAEEYKLAEPDPLTFQRKAVRSAEKYPLGIKELYQAKLGLLSVRASLADLFTGAIYGRSKYQKTKSLLWSGAILSPSTYEIITKGTHFVTPLDLAFEPIGLAPKGSTKLMGKYPAFTLGGFVGEASQFYLFTKALSGVKVGLIGGTKALVKKTPKVFYKLTKEFGLAKPFQKVIYKPKFQNFWQDLYQYSKGGKGFLKEFPMVKGYPKDITHGKVRLYTGFGKIKLDSIKVVEHAKDRLGLQSSFWGRGTPIGKKVKGISRFEFTLDAEKIKVKGLFFKRITESYESIPYKIWSKEIGSSGGLIKGVSKDTTASFAIPHTPSGAWPHEMSHVIKGYIKQSLWKDTKAQQALLSIPKMPTISTHMGHKLAEESIVIPAKYASITPSLSQLSLGIGKISLGLLREEYRVKSRTLRETKTGLESLKDSAMTLAMRQDEETLSRLSFDTKQKMKHKQKAKLATLQELKMSTIHKQPKGGMGHIPYMPLPKLPMLFDLPKDWKRKKKVSFDIKPLKIAHREKEHDVIKLENLFKSNKIKGLKL